MSRLVFILALLMCCAAAVSGQQRPLITEDVDIIPPGSIRIEGGIDFMQGAKYTVSGLNGDLTRVGVIGVSFGMGPNVEFQIEGVAQNYVSINSRGPSAIPLWGRLRRPLPRPGPKGYRSDDEQLMQGQVGRMQASCRYQFRHKQ